jgi:hypothetical protein
MRAALQAALSLKGEAPEGWQPIDMAPKDGTWILVYRASNQGVAEWDAYKDHWRLAPFCYFDRPTHWRPLPAPPTEGKQP